jgi:hypothetical protein
MNRTFFRDVELLEVAANFSVLPHLDLWAPVPVRSTTTDQLAWSSRAGGTVRRAVAVQVPVLNLALLDGIPYALILPVRVCRL